jgi:uncharacterized protein YeaO (DUF488 family)
MPLHCKSVYEPVGSDDGIRLLTTNYWPRGVSKERGGVYKRILGPSRDFLRAFKAGEISWPEYEHRYLRLMQESGSRAEIAAIAELAQTQMVTIMCMCKDEAQCHRRLLRVLIEAAMAKVPA